MANNDAGFSVVVALAMLGGLASGTGIAADAEFTAEQLEWAKCSWGVYEQYGLKDLQERIVFGERKPGDYEKWEDFDIRMVELECGDSMELFWTAPAGTQYKVLKHVHE